MVFNTVTTDRDHILLVKITVFIIHNFTTSIFIITVHNSFYLSLMCSLSGLYTVTTGRDPFYSLKLQCLFIPFFFTASDTSKQFLFQFFFYGS